MTHRERTALELLIKGWREEAAMHASNARNGISGGAYSTQETLLSRIARRHANRLAAFVRRAGGAA